MKRILSCLLTLALLLSLSACAGVTNPSGEEGGEDASPITLSTSGRYAETGITPQAFLDSSVDYGILDNLYAREDGTLDLIVWACWYTAEDHSAAEGQHIWYHSDDRGDTWEERDLPDELATDIHYYNIMLDSAGNVYAFRWPEEERDSSLPYTEIILHCWPVEGEEWSFTVELAEGMEVTSETTIQINDFILYQDRYLILNLYTEQDNAARNRLCAYDFSTRELAWEYEGEPTFTMMEATLAGDSIYVSQSAGYILDAATGEKTGTFDNDKLLMMLDNIQATENGVYYYVDWENNNVCRGIFNQSLEEIILKGAEYQYGTETEVSATCRVLEDGTIYLNAEGLGSRFLNLYRYDYDENASSSAETLTIWTGGTSDTLRQAVSLFRQAHPDVTVLTQVSDGMDRNDAITALNTQLLAGEGPDVLILDGTSYESYMEKGVLSDLTGLYEQLDFVGGTVSSLLSEDGHCYIIPARFTVPVLYGDGLEGVDSLFSFAAAVANAEKPPYLQGGFGNMEQMFWAASSTALVDDSGMDEENLRLWLQALKEIADACGYFTEDEAEMGVVGEAISSSGTFGYANQNICVDYYAFDWIDGSARAGMTQLDSIEGPVTILKEYQEAQGRSAQAFQMIPFPGLAEGAYTPKLLMAVSAASEQQELAKEFVETVLSLEVQQYTYGDGLPVLQEALDQQLDYFSSYAQEYGWDIKELGAILESRTTPVIMDEEVSDVIETAAEAYCRGEQTLEETISAIQTDLSLKLAER